VLYRDALAARRMLAAIQQLATGQSMVRPEPWAAQPAASPYDDSGMLQGLQDNREPSLSILA
jgi:hypothetical protein